VDGLGQPLVGLEIDLDGRGPVQTSPVPAGQREPARRGLLEEQDVGRVVALGQPGQLDRGVGR
jgi:hypothetical protein